MEVEVVKDPSGLWRIKNAPLISTGIEYPLMSGPKTFTEEELVDAVAAQADPAIVEPRIKLGHTSGYNQVLVGDAEMAFGRIDGSTMKMGDNNQTIYGDYLVPGWLGEVMPIAFPNRSIEGNEDAETVTGKEYKLVITAVSLLGIYWPGCQVLEDLPLWYGPDIPDGVEFDEAIAAQLAASKKKVTAKGGKRMPEVLADADISRIRRQFYDRAMNNELEGVDENTYWWWVRGERFADDGGLYLIVEDDDNGDLYRFDVSVSKEDVEFSTPTQVRVEYVKAATAEIRQAVVAGMAMGDPFLVVHASRADTGGPEKTTQEGASNMDEAKRKKLAASCGLPEDATEEQIRARLKQIRAEAEDAGAADDLGTSNTGTPGEGGESAEGTHQTPPGTAPTGTAPSGTEGEPENHPNTPDNDDDVNAGVVRLDKETYEALKAGAEAGLEFKKEKAINSRKEVLDAAVKAGKFPPARRAHYEKLLAADFDGTKQMIDALEPGLIPVEQRGNSGGGADEPVVSAAEGFPADWFPEISAKREAAQRGPAVVTQAKEG